MTLIPVLTFLVFFAGIFAAYWAFVLRPEQEVAGVARKRLRAGKAGDKEAARRSAILKQIEAMSSIGSVDAMLRRSQSRLQGLQTLIHQSGSSVTVGTVIAASATFALLAFVVVQRDVVGGPVGGARWSALRLRRGRRGRGWGVDDPGERASIHAHASYVQV